MKLRNAKHEAAAWSLARNPVQAAAARDAHVDRASITKWLKDPAFSARVDELRMLALQNPPEVADDEASGAAERGLARLIPVAEAVIEAALLGVPYPDKNGKIPSAAQHARALDTIKLAAQLEPKATGLTSAPSLGALIEQADAARAAGS